MFRSSVGISMGIWKDCNGAISQTPFFSREINPIGNSGGGGSGRVVDFHGHGGILI